MAEKFIASDSGKIHLLEQLREGAPLILMIPGMFGAAEDCKPDFTDLQDFSLAAMSIRGRGKSSNNFKSYSFSAQTSDVIAAIDSYPKDNIILFAHSYGCLLSVAACAERVDRIAGLILVDKGLTHEYMSEKWLQNVISKPPPHSSVEVAQRIYDEFTPINLTESFKALQKPTLYFKGEKPGHALKEKEARELELLKHVKMVRLKNSDHWPNPADHATFVSEIKKFANSLGSQ